MSKKRVLSGIQTSGNLHLGNYIGALKQFVELQEDYECYFFLADLHAITVPQDPPALTANIRQAANLHLACGLDPNKAVLFRQSAVSAHPELGWLLNTIATMGELRRMVQFKDKSSGAAEESIGVGLFDYPVLQAADILLYQAELVPVGEDQKQHLELTRDLAERFNNRFSQTFTVPEVLTAERGARVMGLDDPNVKMSKSAASELNYIALTDSTETVKKKIAKAVTDSGSDITAGPDKPAVTNLLTIFSAVSGQDIAALEKEFSGKGYADFKSGLADAIITVLTPIQKRLAELEKDPAETDRLLVAGSERATSVAAKTLAAAKAAMGL